MFRSRTKNMMWYGVLGTKELLHRTYKNLEQRVLLEVSQTGAGCWFCWFQTSKSTQSVSASHFHTIMKLKHMFAADITSCHFTHVIFTVIYCQCDGRPIPLPSLQGIAVLNIPSYAGGTNFWGGTKEDDVRTGPVCLSVCLPFVSALTT